MLITFDIFTLVFDKGNIHVKEKLSKLFACAKEMFGDYLGICPRYITAEVKIMSALDNLDLPLICDILEVSLYKGYNVVNINNYEFGMGHWFCEFNGQTTAEALDVVFNKLPEKYLLMVSDIIFSYGICDTVDILLRCLIKRGLNDKLSMFLDVYQFTWYNEMLKIAEKCENTIARELIINYAN